MGKKNFLEGKLGLADGPELDKAIGEVVETYGKSNAHKLRGVVYYLLTVHFKKHSVYGVEIPEPSPKKAKTGPTPTEKEVEACLKDLKEKCGIASYGNVWFQAWDAVAAQPTVRSAL